MDIIELMIDQLAERLDDLRMHCSITADETRQEVRSIESKLVRLFSEMIFTKATMADFQELTPPVELLKKWLHVVGLGTGATEAILEHVHCLENILECEEHELRGLLESTVNGMDIMLLNRALESLKKCLDSILLNEDEPSDLYWDSWVFPTDEEKLGDGIKLETQDDDTEACIDISDCEEVLVVDLNKTYRSLPECHDFTRKIFMSSSCNFCNNIMFIGVKCKSCKYRCHTTCESYAPAICDEKAHRPAPSHKYNIRKQSSHRNFHFNCLSTITEGQIESSFYYPTSGSSVGSGDDSSIPAYLNERYKQLQFDEQCSNSGLDDFSRRNEIFDDLELGEELTEHNDLLRTYSNASTLCQSLDSSNWRNYKNSAQFDEWDVPFDALNLQECIGDGQFGKVYRALWHGEVAVKLFKEPYVTDDASLEEFKAEVNNLKNTRHENLVLFMGACIKPPHLAIVTALCKGATLYEQIHLRKEQFSIRQSTEIAMQVSHGMEYLHALGILHKDLKSKNIFLENNKAVISDFGLFGARTMHGINIPQGWLCYLAPELIRRLLPNHSTEEKLPFSKATDVFAFGTIWYELLSGIFPFEMQSNESILWQSGNGMKQTLATINASQTVKDVLLMCWAFQSRDRPSFSKLLEVLDVIRKTRNVCALRISRPIDTSF